MELEEYPEDWYRSYLTNRTQEVQVKTPNRAQTFFSDWGTMKHGVPPKISSRAYIVYNIYK